MTHDELKKQTNNHKYFWTGLIKIGLLAGLLLMLSGNVSAQIGNGTSSPSGKNTENSSDKNLKSIARINPSTLAMEMNVPLMTYPGRGGNSLPVGFSYSSKLWQMETGFQWWYWLNTQPRYVTDIHARFAERSAAGWTSSLQPPRIDEDVEIYDDAGQPYSEKINEIGLNNFYSHTLQNLASNPENSLPTPVSCGLACTTYWCDWMSGGGVTCSCIFWEWVTTNCNSPIGGGVSVPTLPGPPPPTPLRYIKRLHVVMSNGSSQEFRQSDTVINCGTSQTGCSPDMTGTFLSVDGTGMRLKRDENGSILYLPDGGKYSFPAIAQNSEEGIYASNYTDINGNTTNYEEARGEQSNEKIRT